ncbi:hypothetical protein GC207_12640 [bacterium]|nr:hypothetical protein [bacterium]
MNSDRNKTYALITLAAALILLALCTTGLEGRFLALPPESKTIQLTSGAAVDHFGPLFSQEPFAALVNKGERRDVFTTTHFNKPPPPPPEPPKPKTRSVALTFLGTLRSSNGDVTAFLRVDEAVSEVVPGVKVINDWGVATIDRSSLVITNATQTNQISFRQTLQLTVPLP